MISSKLLLATLLFAPLSVMTPDTHYPATDDVQAARAKYEKDIADAVEPIRKNFAERMAQLEVELTKKGDLDGALAARTERERVGPIADVGTWRALVGTWQVRFENGATHTYDISGDGTVRFIERKMTLSLRRQGHDVVIDFGNGKVERVSDSFAAEMFENGGYPNGTPTTKGHASRKER